MKKFFAFIVSLLMIIPVSIPVSYATQIKGPGSIEDSVYVVDGKKYVDINGETYRYICINDDPDTDNKFNLETPNSIDNPRNSYLPVPPSYDYNLGNGSYSDSVNLSSGDQWTPIFRRDTQKLYTKFTVHTTLNQTVSLSYFWYDALNQRWEGDTLVNEVYNIILSYRRLEFSGQGDSAQGLRILFYDFDNSTQQFNYTVEDTSML